MYILKIFVMVCPCIVSNAFSFRFSMNILRGKHICWTVTRRYGAVFAANYRESWNNLSNKWFTEIHLVPSCFSFAAPEGACEMQRLTSWLLKYIKVHMALLDQSSFQLIIEKPKPKYLQKLILTEVCVNISWWEVRLKTGKLSKVREKPGDQARIGFRVGASFLGQSLVKVKQNQSNYGSSFDTQSKKTL